MGLDEPARARGPHMSKRKRPTFTEFAWVAWLLAVGVCYAASVYVPEVRGVLGR